MTATAPCQTPTVDEAAPNVSVVVCTYARPDLVAEALHSVIRQSCAPAYEVVVVDNDPHRSAEHVVERAGQRGQSVRYVAEPAVGLSRARLTGWREARGDIVAFLDDDAVADAGWVAGVAQGFAGSADRVACIGGRVEPVFEAAVPPGWPPSWTGRFDLGTLPRAFGPGEFAWGCNMAFRRSWLSRVGAFSQDLGRRGDRPVANEDVLVQKQIDRAGGTRLWWPDASIHHLQPRERLTREWVRRRSYWQGVSDSWMDHYLDGGDGRARLHRAARHSRRSLRAATTLLGGISDAGRRLSGEAAVLHAVGQLRGSLLGPR